MRSHTNPPRRTRTRFPGVYRSVSGKYEIQFRDSDGRLRFRTVDGTLEEAKTERAVIVAKLAKGETVRPTRRRFADFAEDWISALDKRPRTLAAYRYALDRHLLPRLARRKLADISVDDVARLVVEMKRQGFAGWTIVGTLSTLSACLGKARRRGLIPVNPVSELERGERPTVNGDGKRVLSEDEIAAVLDAASETFRPPVALLLFSGLRLGEALGLRWHDVDFERGFLRVRNQLDPARTLVPLKTGAARRDVVLIPQLARLLRAWRMRSPFKAPSDYVFPGPDGRGRDHRSLGRGIERTIEKAGLAGEGISAHAFRHSFASLLIVGLKLDPVGVARQLGHSNPATTLRTYAREFDKARHADETRAALGEKFGGLLGASEGTQAI